MANSTAFDPLTQSITLYLNSSYSIPVPLADVDELRYEVAGININYSSQIGACFTMLLVMLAMTPRARLLRPSNFINVAALVLGTFRCVLLSLYFTSSFLDFYPTWSGDYSYVSANDVRISVTAEVLLLPQLMLIYAALMAQAWSIMRLWTPVWHAAAMAVSVVVLLTGLAFKTADVWMQVCSIVGSLQVADWMWLREIDFGIGVLAIAWFCFLFMARLVAHMWEHRSMLPSVRGLSAMEILVMTNGVLMLFPRRFFTHSRPRAWYLLGINQTS